jgi:exodeoxyribonuclease-3
VKRGLGWRIDHILATPPLAARCLACEIDMAPRLADKPSDHTILMAEFRPVSH